MDLFIVTDILNGLGVLPYYVIHDGKYHRILCKGTRKECKKFLDNLCESCCQLYRGEKTDFCKECIHHSMYVHK